MLYKYIITYKIFIWRLNMQKLSISLGILNPKPENFKSLYGSLTPITEHMSGCQYSCNNPCTQPACKSCGKCFNPFPLSDLWD